MSDFWAYDGTGTPGGWRNIQELWAYDGSAWKEIVEAWVYDGSAWRKVLESAAPDCGAAPTCDGIFDGWINLGRFGNCGVTCGTDKCTYSIGINHTDCDDVCHNMDGWMSLNGGSYLLRNACTSLTCANQTGCAVGGEFDCILSICFANTNTYQGRVIIQKTFDSSTICTITHSQSRTGNCDIA